MGKITLREMDLFCKLFEETKDQYDLDALVKSKRLLEIMLADLVEAEIFIELELRVRRCLSYCDKYIPIRGNKE